MAQRLSISNKQAVLFGLGLTALGIGVGIGIYQSQKRKKKLQQKTARQTTNK